MQHRKKARLVKFAAKRRRSDAHRRINQADRMARILRILELIQGNGRWNVRGLAQEFGCTEQTIYRNLRVLEYAGVPFHFDRENQCYRVRDDFRFPVLNLSREELVGQAVATSATNAPGLDVSRGAEPTTRKLAAISMAESRAILIDAERLIQVLSLQLVDHSRHREVVRTIQTALLNRRQLAGRYVSPYKPQALTIQLHPYRLCLVKNAWYVIGKTERLGDVRTLRVARFKRVRSLKAAADIPGDFDLQKYFGNAWAVYRGKQRFDVIVRFDKELATVAAETKWHRTQKVEKHGNGTATFMYRVEGLEEVLNWIMRWTGHVEILQPPELGVLYRRRLQRGVTINRRHGP